MARPCQPPSCAVIASLVKMIMIMVNGFKSHVVDHVGTKPEHVLNLEIKCWRSYSYGDT